jgi:hypothetical protein
MSTFLTNEDVTGPFLTCTSFSTVQSCIGSLLSKFIIRAILFLPYAGLDPSFSSFVILPPFCWIKVISG